jgi:hypothetical protein
MSWASKIALCAGLQVHRKTTSVTGDANRRDNDIPLSDEKSSLSFSILANASTKVSRKSKTTCLYSCGAVDGAMNSGLTANRSIGTGRAPGCDKQGVGTKGETRDSRSSGSTDLSPAVYIAGSDAFSDFTYIGSKE